ncbi:MULTISPECIES: phosphatase PAP2 family protein [Micromonospora]|uniref:Inositol phosphorylceramide synthase n=1 Tax=Micromonospora solifontis TaxID=2487138 RepID=A0ABX9WC84_9ACTN|nr:MULTISPECIES: phosphatase PAP2 family protein [Micromonospora]NES13186.1 inositol phosphorylceramide synthase [Micromonospora sp. PPF5-17B]NES39208.1 inositol phosphorylceramide synthase [Micromonospora solifontis]NES55108.1 inositol phosphorylceramide synthase [Micromonospora sp. PPF5-6]RNL90155.1 inositol phosphorylceramide synthase [Micromonospora solifontis]
MATRTGWAARELALVAALFLAYKAGRVAVTGRTSTALANGERVWLLERLLHLPSEAVTQQPLLAHDLLIRLANCYYAYVHFPATVCCLVWLYVRRPGHYLWLRRALAALTAAALALHLLVPLAPPRMTALTGLVDTGRRFGPAVYGSPDADTLSNQYAAMPSLHVGWALAVAVALVAVTAGRWRWLWLAHPLVTLLVVVVTGNHYWLDAVVATCLLVPILAMLRRPSPDRRPEAVPVAAGTVRPHVVDRRRIGDGGHRRRDRVGSAGGGRHFRPPGRG